ncbi:MAG: hypothetical protein BMS9Abin11_1632 [Gammaproteobacteria bacterium]|nr:MAG: hypothetical protein BMS9Abin11_1632 [Gammaproteobacteria bacterium]
MNMNKKTKIYFGPPLSTLTENEKNTMEISGKINRTAERYLEILRHHRVDLTEPERECLTKICDFGFMASYEIFELADEVSAAEFEVKGLDREALIKKLESTSFAGLVTIVEELGF